MTGAAGPRRRPAGAAHWVLLILLVGVADLMVLGYRVGRCVDVAPDSAAQSMCTVEPAIGVPGAWLVGVASALVLLFAVARLVRVLRGR